MAQLRALLIDDEPDQTTYMSTLLEDQGWQVRSANSADEGLALAQEEVPDVVLLDVMMPERGGLSTLIALRKDQTRLIDIEHIPQEEEQQVQDQQSQQREAA